MLNNRNTYDKRQLDKLKQIKIQQANQINNRSKNNFQNPNQQSINSQISDNRYSNQNIKQRDILLETIYHSDNTITQLQEQIKMQEEIINQYQKTFKNQRLNNQQQIDDNNSDKLQQLQSLIKQKETIIQQKNSQINQLTQHNENYQIQLYKQKELMEEVLSIKQIILQNIKDEGLQKEIQNKSLKAIVLDNYIEFIPIAFVLQQNSIFKLEDLQSFIEQMHNFQEQIQFANEQVQYYQNDINQKIEEITNKDNQNQSLLNQNNQNQKQISSLSSQVESLKKEMIDLKLKNEWINKDNQSQTIQIKKFDEIKKQFQESQKEYLIKIEQAELLKNEINQERKTLQNQIIVLSQENIQFQINNRKLENQILIYQNEVSLLKENGQEKMAKQIQDLQNTLLYEQKQKQQILEQYLQTINTNK